MNRLLTLSEMSSQLNTCTKAFRGHVTKQKIPHIKIGRRLMFDRDVVVAHLSQVSTDKQKPKRRSVYAVSESEFAGVLG